MLLQTRCTINFKVINFQHINIETRGVIPHCTTIEIRYKGCSRTVKMLQKHTIMMFAS